MNLTAIEIREIEELTGHKIEELESFMIEEDDQQYFPPSTHYEARFTLKEYNEKLKKEVKNNDN